MTPNERATMRRRVSFLLVIMMVVQLVGGSFETAYASQKQIVSFTQDGEIGGLESGYKERNNSAGSSIGESQQENPTGESAEEPTEGSTDPTEESPQEDPTKESTEEPTEGSTDPTEESTQEDPTEESTEGSTEESTEGSTEESTESSTEESTEESKPSSELGEGGSKGEGVSDINKATLGNAIQRIVKTPVEYIHIAGEVTYSGDEEWIRLIRPDTFNTNDMTLRLVYEDEDGENYKKEIKPQSGQSTDEYHFTWVYGEDGCFSYDIVNIPNRIGGETSDLKLVSLEVVAKAVNFYGEASRLVEIDSEVSDYQLDIVREPNLGTVTVAKKIPGVTEGDEAYDESFNVTLTGKRDGVKPVDKDVAVKMATPSQIQVPKGKGITYTIEEKDKENYALLYYMMDGKKVDNEENPGQVSFAFNDGKDHTVTVVNSRRNVEKEWQVEWLDNQASGGRPENLKFQLMYSTDGGVTYTELTNDTCADIGLAKAPEYKTREGSNAGIQTLYYDGLPDSTADGDPISYKVSLGDVDSPWIKGQDGAVYWIREVKGQDGAADKFLLHLCDDFQANIKWSDEADDGQRRATPEQIKNVLNLYYFLDGKYYRVTAGKDGEQGAEGELLSPERWSVEEVEGQPDQWIVKFDEVLPKYSEGGSVQTYVLVVGTMDENGTVTPPPKVPMNEDYNGLAHYDATYYNGQTSHGNVFDKCYDDQQIIFTLVNSSQFTATKIWQDANPDERPDVTVTLWRYPVKADTKGELENLNSPEVLLNAARVTARGANDQEILLSYQLDKTKDSELIDFKTHVKDLPPNYDLPRYDELGREYRYFVRETVTGENNNYKTIYESATPSNAAAPEKLTYGTNNGGTIINRRYEDTPVKVEKEWKAASVLSDVDGKELTFVAIGRSGDGTYHELKTIKAEDGSGSDKIGNFSSDKTKGGTTFYVNGYDENGKPYDIVGAVETKITDKDGQEYQLTYDLAERKCQFKVGDNTYIGECEIATDSDGNRFYRVTNTVTAKKDYTIEKIWQDGTTPQDLELRVYGESIQPGKSQQTEYEATMDPDTGRGTIWVDGKEYSFDMTMTKENGGEHWSLPITNLLPKYDSEGYLINYKTEELTRGPWHVDYEYYDDKTVMWNSIDGEGNAIRVKKIWDDDGDAAHRYPVEVQVIIRETGEVERTAILSQYNLWETKIAVATKANAYLIKEASLIPNGQLSYKVEHNESNVPGEPYARGTGTVTTDHHTYKVTYGEEWDDITGVWIETITNTRTDVMDIKVIKEWLDGENQDNSRPDSLDFVVKRDGIVYTSPGAQNQEITIESTNSDQVTVTSSEWQITLLTGVPKYDEKGKLYTYSVEEKLPEDSDYKLISTESEFLDEKILQYKFVNRLSKKTDFTVYKVWKDKATGGINRPDLYLTLYQYDKGDGTGKETKTHTIYEDQLWTPGTSDQLYHWKIQVDDLPKYNEYGVPYIYYMTERMNENGASIGISYKYAYENNTIVGSPTNAAYDEGYIINRLEDTMTISGEKIWQNVEGYAKDSLPIPVIKLYRDLRADANDTPQLMNSVTLENGGTKFAFATDSNAEPLQKYSPDGELYDYSISEEIEFYEGNDLHKVEKDLIYTKVNMANFSMENVFNREKNNRTIVVSKFWDEETLEQVAKEYLKLPSVTFNLYRYLKPEDGEIPDRTTKTKDLPYRQVTIDSSELLKALKDETVARAVFDDLLIYAPNGRRYWYYIEESPIEGYDTAYYAIATLENAESTAALDGISVAEDDEGNGIGIDICDKLHFDVASTADARTVYVSAENAYKPETISFTGQKQWIDHGNFFKCRPDEVTVKLYRSAPSQIGQGNGIPLEEVEIATDGNAGSTNAGPTITWDKSKDELNIWEYTIDGLAKYAPNGQKYTYKVVEVLKDGSQYKAIVNGVTTKYLEDGITVGVLKNELDTSYRVEKHWIDGDDQYGFRPMTIKVKLQWATTSNAVPSDEGSGAANAGETDTEGTESPWKDVPNPDGEGIWEVELSLKNNGVSGTNGATWSYEFKALPAMTKEGYPYHYQCVETYIGDTELLEDGKVGAYQAFTTYPIPGNKTTIKNVMTTTSLTVTKIWEDENNKYLTRPDELKFRLESGIMVENADGTKSIDWKPATASDATEVTVKMTSEDLDSSQGSNGSKWVKTFDNLPSVNGDGKKLYYRAVEIVDNNNHPDVDGTIYHNYELDKDNSGDINDDTGNFTTVTNRLISTDLKKITAQKTWIKDEGTAAYDIVFELQAKLATAGDAEFAAYPEAGKKSQQTLLKDASEPLEVFWENLPDCTQDGQKLAYRIIEKTERDGFMTVATPTDAAVPSAAHEAIYKFKNIQLTNFEVTKQWKDNENGALILPSGKTHFEATVQLQRQIDSGAWEDVKTYKDEKTGEVKDGERILSVRKETPNGSATVTFQNLPKYTEEGKLIRYRAVETEINGIATSSNASYTTKYEYASEGNDAYKTSCTITNTLVTVPISLTKKWVDESNNHQLRPNVNNTANKIKIKLLADYDGNGSNGSEEVPAKNYTISWTENADTNTWTAEIKDLPKYAPDGKTEIIYSVDESRIPENYTKTGIETSTPGDANGEYGFTITNKLNPRITLKKIDAVDRTALQGVEFTLYEATYDEDTKEYKRGEQVGSTVYTTNDKGQVEIWIPETGWYELVETKTVHGYQLGNSSFSCFFQITEADYDKIIDIAKREGIVTTDERLTKAGLKNNRIPGTVTIHKQDGDTKLPLSGVTFELFKKNDGQATSGLVRGLVAFFTGRDGYDSMGQYTTDANGNLTIKDLEWGKYKLVEIKSQDGYTLSDPKPEFTFTVDADTVADKDNNPVATIDVSGTTAVDNVKNVITNNKNQISFQKQSEDGKTLNGGIFEIQAIKADGTLATPAVAFFLTATEGDASKKVTQFQAGDDLYGIPAGNYALVEVKAPAGYKKAEPVTFSIDEKGNVEKKEDLLSSLISLFTRDGWPPQTVVMKDEPIQLSILKVDDTLKKNQLSGAVFKVSGIFADGSGKTDGEESVISGLTVENFATSLKGHLIASTGTEEGKDRFTYTLEETTAPEGFVRQDEPVRFYVTEDGDVRWVEQSETASWPNFVEKGQDNNGIPVLYFQNSPDYCSVTITKTFIGDSLWAESIRPTSVKLQLYRTANGEKEKVGEPKVLTVNTTENSYTYTVDNLPTHKQYIKDGKITTAKFDYTIEEEDISPYYIASSGNATETDGNYQLLITNSAEEQQNDSPLVIRKVNRGGPQADLFKFRVDFSYRGKGQAVFKDSYEVYEISNGSGGSQGGNGSGDKLLKVATATDGYIELHGGEYAKLNLPKGAEYEVTEVFYGTTKLPHYAVQYDAYRKGVIGATPGDATPGDATPGDATPGMAATTVTNNALIYTAIDNTTLNFAKQYPQGQWPHNAGGNVEVQMGIFQYLGAYDQVDYQENKLVVCWKPKEDWQVVDTFRVVYREYDGDDSGKDDGEIIVTGFLNPDGSVKDKSDPCYDGLRKRYPDFDIGVDIRGAIWLRLANDTEGVPYLNRVFVGFTPTLAVINTSKEAGTGQVQVENGQLHFVADGKGLHGEGRYQEVKVYGKAENGYQVDLNDLSIGLVDTIAGIGLPNILTFNGKVTISLKEDRTFEETLKYEMAGVTGEYVLKGKVEILKTDSAGRPVEIALILENLPIPVDIGIPFVKIPSPGRPGNGGGGGSSGGSGSGSGGGPGPGTVTSNQGGTIGSSYPAGGSRGVKTGDTTYLGLWILLLLASAAVMGVSVRKEKKKKRK